jgi:clan AA aspartic protease
MMVGTVSARPEATLRLQFQGIGVPPEEIELVIDTGFTVEVALPRSLIARLALPFLGRTQVILADGTSHPVRYYRATVLWDHQPRSITVLEMGGDPLIGMGLLYGHIVLVDVVDGGTVAILPRA